jgi:hypothetical protein
MAYGHSNRNSGIVWLNNYAEALKKWEETKPIARRKTDDRPLGHRRNTWYLINKGKDDKIECKMYGTPIVTFHKDGRVEITNYNYNTTSTANFIWDVLRSKVNAYIFDFSLVIGIGKLEQRIKVGESLFIELMGDGNYHFLDHKPEVTHTINRANAKAIRARYQDFMQYLDGMAKLRGAEPYSREELEKNMSNELYNLDIGRIRYYNTYHEEHANKILNALAKFKAYISDTGEDRHIGYYKAMLVMVHSFGKYDWHTKGFVVDTDAMARNFDKALMGLHRNEYFDAKPTDSGQAKRDTYRAYFTGVWDKYNANA